jgi:60 kDa SS-A/Ro ribonucleoprotein
MKNYAKNVSQRQTPQSQPVAGKAETQNLAGGYVFTMKPEDQIQRFCILGAEGSTYYATERQYSLKACQNMAALAVSHPRQMVDIAVKVSDEGRAPKNDPAIFLIALASALAPKPEDRRYAIDQMPKVCRTGTHLLQFVSMADELRGWGRSLTTGVGNWFLQKPPADVLFQALKYRNRAGWTPRDVLRKSHPKTSDEQMNQVFKWIVSNFDLEKAPDLKNAHLFKSLQTATSAAEVATMVKVHGAPREFLPTQFLNDPAVQKAMLPGMPLTALIRNLGNLTKSGALAPLSSEVDTIVAKLTDQAYVQKSRVHPLNVWVAKAVYQSGQGLKGSGSWTPISQVTQALEKCFYLAFKNVEPTNLKYMLAFDVSGSMNMSNCGGYPMTPRTATAVIGSIIFRTEPKVYPVAFTSSHYGHDGISPVNANGQESVDKLVETLSNFSFGGTDCALPMVHALKNKLDVDVFVVMTDNESWAGSIHPFQALKEYRNKMNKPNAKLVCMAFTATKYSIADPNDPGMLDIAGFDSAVHQVLSEFVRGLPG